MLRIYPGQKPEKQMLVGAFKYHAIGPGGEGEIVKLSLSITIGSRDGCPINSLDPKGAGGTEGARNGLLDT